MVRHARRGGRGQRCNNVQGQGTTPTTERFVTDAIGNRWTSRSKSMRASTHPDTAGIRDYTFASSGALTYVTSPYSEYSNNGFFSDKALSYDESGNLSLTARREMDAFNNSNFMWDATRYYYDAGDKLRIVNRAIGPYANDETHPGERNVFEEYYYDALGRRVITRTRRTTSCSTTGVEECNSTLQRTVWDGDQILMEVRSNGATDASSEDLETNGPYGTAAKAYPYGRVAYVHAGGIDQPVAVNRIGMANATDVTTIYPHQNWRGQFEFGTLIGGTLANNSNIRWPGARTTVDGVVGEDADGFYWYGSLVQGMSDGSGMVYQRNRYYDPATGRFTQEDPIGLAGGVNAYGFASGDRVNFSDPMGLCPICLGAYAAFEAGSAAYDAYQTYKAFKRSRQEGAQALNASLMGAIAPGPGNAYLKAGRYAVNEAVSDPRLWKKLAFDELLSDAQQGIGGRVIAGAGHSRQIDNVDKLVSAYGGEAGDWAKVVGQTRTGPGGISQQVHWYENTKTHQRVDFKPANPP